jgi:uncharacterized membrane protein YphA (DoxX/SURF4 family)
MKFVNYIVLLVRLVLVAAFLLAAIPKIKDPVGFAGSVESYRILTGQAVLWVALVLPWLELLIGFGLLVPRMRRASSLLIILLLFIFIGLHASAWIRGLDIDCGCYAIESVSSNYFLLISRNCALIIAAVFVLTRDWRNHAWNGK